MTDIEVTALMLAAFEAGAKWCDRTGYPMAGGKAHDDAIDTGFVEWFSVTNGEIHASQERILDVMQRCASASEKT